jgi:hypothetical protein
VIGYPDDSRTVAREEAIERETRVTRLAWIDIIRRSEPSECHMDSFVLWLQDDVERNHTLNRVVCALALRIDGLQRYLSDIRRLRLLGDAYRECIAQATLEEPDRSEIGVGAYVWIATRAAQLMPTDIDQHG